MARWCVGCLFRNLACRHSAPNRATREPNVPQIAESRAMPAHMFRTLSPKGLAGRARVFSSMAEGQSDLARAVARAYGDRLPAMVAGLRVPIYPERKRRFHFGSTLDFS